VAINTPITSFFTPTSIVDSIRPPRVAAPPLVNGSLSPGLQRFSTSDMKEAVGSGILSRTGRARPL
jgi:hypothetical protein